MSVFSQSLFALVGGNFMSFSFSSARHTQFFNVLKELFILMF